MEGPQKFESLTRRRIISGAGIAAIAALFSTGEAEGMGRIEATIRSLKREIKRAKKIKNARRRNRKLRSLRRMLRMYESL